MPISFLHPVGIYIIFILFTLQQLKKINLNKNKNLFIDLEIIIHYFYIKTLEENIIIKKKKSELKSLLFFLIFKHKVE